MTTQHPSTPAWLDTYTDEELADAETAQTIPCPPPTATIPPPPSETGGDA